MLTECLKRMNTAELDLNSTAMILFVLFHPERDGVGGGVEPRSSSMVGKHGTVLWLYLFNLRSNTLA